MKTKLIAIILLIGISTITSNCYRIKHSAQSIRKPVSLHRVSKDARTVMVTTERQFSIFFGVFPIGDTTENIWQEMVDKNNYRTIDEVKSLQKVRINSTMGFWDIVLTTIGIGGVLFNSHTVTVQAEVTDE